MKIGDRCFVHGYIDEIRKDTVIIKNKGGYFGTDTGDVITVNDTYNKRVGNISTCVYCYPTCSECGKVGIETYKYCPHCGAKMEGVSE